MKKFVFIGCVLLSAHNFIATSDTPVNNDVQITEPNIFEGIGAITHRPIRLAVGEVIGRGEGLCPADQRPILTRVISFEENATVVAYHNQIIAAAQQNAH
jgi:hypothetical protein